MIGRIKQYIRWLHTQWPAGMVEKLPQVREDGSTNIPGLYIVGDLTGIPLLKFSSDTGARAVQTIAADSDFRKLRTEQPDTGVLDVVIIGAGVSGMAAALAAKKAGLFFELLEASEPFSTVVNFPKQKPIYTYPTDMVPAGDLQFTATVKEPLVEELHAQTMGQGIKPRIARAERVIQKGKYLEVVMPEGKNLPARRVIVAIGRSGNFRKLGVPGEDLDKVYNRLHDPKDFCDTEALVVGGGDSALETAIAVAQCGGHVILSYRKKEFSRPKPDNVERLQEIMEDPAANVQVETPSSERVTTSAGGFLGSHRKRGSIRLLMGSSVKSIEPERVTMITAEGREEFFPNAAVFSMIGREAPLELFRRSGVRISGEMGTRQWTLFSLFFLFCVFLYNWKAGGALKKLFESNQWFPFNVAGWLQSLGGSIARLAGDTSTVIGTLNVNLADPGFYYSLVYTLLIVVFGIRRINRRKTPYIKVQMLTLMSIQVVPLFLLPFIILPYLGNNGLFDYGVGQTVADALFPQADYGHGREYWRAFGFILAWPLFVWNVFSDQPMWTWLGISLVQTFVIIPLIIYRWGKGAYCGWICSCGALAESMGDTHRHKMPHGAFWNRVNLVGQGILVLALLLLIGRVISWSMPGSGPGMMAEKLYHNLLNGWNVADIQFNYYWIVDVFLAGVVGMAFYFWFSGRIWCRFACPLAALMHIFARFSRFRILSNKKKCISCNVCTAVCHQGIDVMNFANKGLPMEDPECVRCSACVQSCPTGVLEFGQVHPKTGEVISKDSLAASPVLMRERE